MSTATLATPIGPIAVSAMDGRLVSLRFAAERIAADPLGPDSALLREALAQLSHWFSGRSTRFDLPLEPPRTPRGMALRAAIAAIPYGETASYSEVAGKAGSGPRAIGQACRRNPLPIIIPCHRVIGAGQTIGHYSGGNGVDTKRWLLAHEQTHKDPGGDGQWAR